MHSGPGGKGRNQAVAAALTGGRVAIVGCVGDDVPGRAVLEDLIGARIDVSHVTATSTEPTGRYVCLAGPSGSSSSAWFAGANAAVTEEAVAQAGTALSATYVLCQLEIPDEAVAAVVRMRTGRVVLDCGPDPERAEQFVGHAWMVRANASEASLLTGIDVVDEGSARRAAACLLRRGPRWASVSAGPAGDLLASHEGAWWRPAPDVEVVDPTGAGDALLGVTVACLAVGLSPAAAARAGARAASQVMQHLGARIEPLDGEEGSLPDSPARVLW